MAAIVFHLMRMRAKRICAEARLRYDFDPRCDVERGDVWVRTTTEGEVTGHRVVTLRIYEGICGEELHVFLVPEKIPAIL